MLAFLFHCILSFISLTHQVTNFVTVSLVMSDVFVSLVSSLCNCPSRLYHFSRGATSPASEVGILAPPLPCLLRSVPATDAGSMFLKKYCHHFTNTLQHLQGIYFSGGWICSVCSGPCPPPPPHLVPLRWRGRGRVLPVK